MRRRINSWPRLRSIERLEEEMWMITKGSYIRFDIQLPVTVNTDNCDSFFRDRINFFIKHLNIFRYSDLGDKKDYVILNRDEIEKFVSRPNNNTYKLLLISILKEIQKENISSYDECIVVMDAPPLFWFEHPEIKAIELPGKRRYRR